MPSRRDQIRMSEAERLGFLEAERTVCVATLGPRGWPHVMPLWYVVREGELWSWTYARSQKVRNLERDDRATCLVEAGSEYQELRGVQIEARAELHRERAGVLHLGREIAARYTGASPEGPALEALEAQAEKRVAIRFVPERTLTWDHRKLGGGY